MSKIHFLSLNTQHSEIAITNLYNKITEYNHFIYSIQEPYVPRNKLPSIPRGASANYGKIKARAALLYSKHLNVWDVPAYTGRDIATSLLKIKTGKHKEIYIASVYLDILYKDKDFFPEELIKLINLCQNKKKALILNIDSNSHSVLWGQETNRRGETMEELIINNNLKVQNIGAIPTFVTKRTMDIKTCIDVTLTMNMEDVKEWEVTNHVTLSDHKEISYTIDCSIKKEIKKVYLHNKLDVNGYNQNIITKLPKSPKYYSKGWLEKSSDEFATNIITSFEANCPMRTIKSKTKKPHYWNKDITSEKRGAKKAYRQYCKDKTDANWTKYAELRNNLRRVIRNAKKKAWQKHCQELNNIKDMSKLMKAVQKVENRALGLIQSQGKDEDCPESTIDSLMDTHWPGSTKNLTNDNEKHLFIEKYIDKESLDKKESGFINTEKVKWAIMTFGPGKAAGPDGIKPMMLQKLGNKPIEHLTKLFKISMELQHVPSCWRDSQAVFIPKPGKDSYDIPKAFRPISLTTFIWKAFERIILNEIETTYLTKNPLSSKQHAFRKGSSCETALSDFTDKIESAIQRDKYALGIFLDIQGAFDNLDPMAAIKGMRDKKIPEKVINHYSHYLNNRSVTVTYKGIKQRRLLTRGTPQGGVLSPLVWNLSFDSLLKSYQNGPIDATGFADDCALLMTGIDPEVLTDLGTKAIKKAFKWGAKRGLTFGASKTVIVLFHRKNKVTMPEPIKVDGLEIPFSESAKYLGIELDSKLNYNKHITEKLKKSKRLLYALSNAIGQLWGPSPALIRWAYTGMIRPIITYGSIIWSHRAERFKIELRKLQRLAMLATSHILKSSPTEGLEVIMGLPPLHLYCEYTAINAYLRIKGRNESHWDGIGLRKRRGHLQLLTSQAKELKIDDIVMESKPKSIIWNKGYQINQESFTGGLPIAEKACCFTDGSKLEGHVGWGFHINKEGLIHEGHGRLNNEASVFQAEITAITKAAEYILDQDIKADRWDFFCDSLGAIKALGGYEVETELITECARKVSSISTAHKCPVYIHWIKAHVGHTGNERADELAKSGTALDTTHIQIIPAPRSLIKGRVEKGMMDKWNRSWTRNEKLYRQTRFWFQEPNINISKKLFRQDRTTFGKTIQVITGHNYLNYHQNKLDRAENQMCRYCDNIREDAIHIITECPAFSKEREATSGISGTPQMEIYHLENLIKGPIGEILRPKA